MSFMCRECILHDYTQGAKFINLIKSLKNKYFCKFKSFPRLLFTNVYAIFFKQHKK